MTSSTRSSISPSHYYEHRGDDFGRTTATEAVIWKELQNLLSLYRDPALA